MKLNFLGYGAAFYPRLGNNNAYFEIGENIYFLDFGEMAFHTVMQYLDISKYKEIYIILTHMHADHCGSVASLASYMYCVLHKVIHIIHPVDTIVQLLTLQGIAKNFYTFSYTLPQNLGFSIQAYEVQHALDMKSFGYILSDENSSIYYSGDAADIPKDVLSKFLSGKISRIYQDTASHFSSSHCHYTHLEQLIPQSFRNNVYCMHIDGDYIDLLKAKGFSVVEPIA